MENALPILLFLGFLFGGTLLILICGIQGREQDEKPALGADPFPGVDLQSMPRFFGRPGERDLAKPVMVVVDAAMVLQVEEFLRQELELAEVFVDDPTVERLHQQPDVEKAGPSVFERLESFLRREQQVAADFVSSPSVENLYGHFQPAPLPA